MQAIQCFESKIHEIKHWTSVTCYFPVKSMKWADTNQSQIWKSKEQNFSASLLVRIRSLMKTLIFLYETSVEGFMSEHFFKNTSFSL